MFFSCQCFSMCVLYDWMFTLKSSDGMYLSTFSLVRYLSTILRYLYFTRVFPFSASLYLHSTTFWRLMLYILLHSIYLTTLVTSYIAGRMMQQSQSSAFLNKCILLAVGIKKQTKNSNSDYWKNAEFGGPDGPIIGLFLVCSIYTHANICILLVLLILK